MDVLVLENVPDKSFSQKITSLVQRSPGTSLVYDVVEVSRRDSGLERAVRFFTSDKIVVPSFEEAVKAQGAGARDIVTLDGTEFKAGMISGGHHSNVFKL